ncbi:uncharacterized protein V6R79_024473 [Siganus canaliculatus]
MPLFTLLLLTLLTARGNSVCRLQDAIQPPELVQDGDLVIGGIFSFRTGQDYVINTFKTFPKLRKCKNFNFREFKFAQAMIFAINEVNKNPNMLPNMKLGYKIYDNCGTMDILRAALALTSGMKGEVSGDNCTETESVQAILGHSGSRPTIAFARVVGRFQIPVISHFATCACLSNRKEYPTFFRTIPSDYYQSRALAKLVKHFGWTWIGIVAVDNEYGLNGISAFKEAAQEYGVCIEYSEAFSSSDPPERLRRITKIIKHATSKVIMAFMSHREIKLLATDLYQQNITGLQWVGSDAWITDHSLTDSVGHSILVGSLGFTVSKAQITGLGEHLRQFHPSQFPESQFVRDFWEYTFDCVLNEPVNTNPQRKPCSGSESLQNIESQFTNVAELRFTNNVYKSVMAVAHALDNLVKCKENGSCADIKLVQPWQVLHYLNTVNFTTEEGQRVYFDSNGDSPARYELVNIQMTHEGTMEGRTVGIYDASLPESNQFTINSSLVVWGNHLTKGDIMIGGIFPVFNKETSSTSTFESQPPGVTCAGFDLRVFRWTQVMIFAIEEINKDSTLLPNISLGYRILNSCASPTNTLRAAFTLASGPKETELSSLCPPTVSAIIAESGSTQSLAVAGTLGPFHVPIVSYFSTCACLSDRAKYPTFFRTIPSDYFQAKALAALVNHFGWKWIGAIQSDNDYGRNGILAFTKEVEKLGVCISFVGTVLRTYPKDKILDVVEMIKMSTVKVIMAFVPEGDLYPLMKEVVKQNITGIQWIASEAWITAPRPSTKEIYQAFGGALGFVMQKMAIPDLKPYLTAINPYTDHSAAFVKDFWEIMVGCKPFSPVQLSDTEATNEICTGNETLMNSQDMFFNITQLRVSYNVYKAVYAIAHALHHLVFCHPVGKKQARPCLNISEIQPKQVTEHLQKVNFTDEFGGNVFFDTNGDPPASYDIINWQLRDGQVQHVTLGHFASDANGDYKLSIQEDKIVWRTGNKVKA